MTGRAVPSRLPCLGRRLCRTDWRVPPVCPSSVVRGGTPGNGEGRGGMANPREIKAIAGNSVSCLRFPIALPTGSSPVLLARGSPATSTGCWAFSFPSFPPVPSVCRSGVGGRSGVELEGHRPVKLLHRALPGLRREVGVAHRHFDGGIAGVRHWATPLRPGPPAH